MATLSDIDVPALLKEVKTCELHIFGVNKALISRISVLNDLLEAAYAARCPEPSDHERRRNLIGIFNLISKELYGNSCPAIAEFGSFVMNMFTSDSDIDLSINFNNPDVPRKERIQTLRRFSKKFKRLESKGIVKNVQLIPSARVPVLKVTDCATNIDCDFSVENKDGVEKSHLIFIIACIDERFRKLSTLMKVWAKTQGINSSRDGTLNSLSLILLTAFHLQCAEPPILPPFSALLKDGLDRPTVTTNVLPFVNYGQKNKQSLLQLFVTLLIRLKSVETLWADGLCVSVTEGSWTHKIFSKNRSMSIEDFTDRSQNVARAVTQKKAIKIYQCIDKSLSQINSFVDGKIDGQMLETLLFGLCPDPLTKPIMACDQSQSAPCNLIVAPVPKKRKRIGKRKRALLNGTATLHQSSRAVLHNPAPFKGNITHEQSATYGLQDPNPTKNKQLAAEKVGTLSSSKVVMTCDQSATVVLQDSIPTKRMMQLAEEKKGLLAPSKGVMIHDQRATHILHDAIPANNKGPAPSKGAMSHDQNSPLQPVLHKPSPGKKKQMARTEQPRKHASPRTGGTPQVRTRPTQETDAFDRRGSYAAHIPSRYTHGGEGMWAHESFPRPFAHEHSLYQSSVGFPYGPSHPSTLGFPTAIPNAPLHPPPRAVNRVPPPLHDRSLDPYIEPVGRPEPPYLGRLSQTWPDHPYELGRPRMSYESELPRDSYELSRSHMPYVPDRPLRSYEPDYRPLRSYEPDRHHRSYEPDRLHRSYEPDRLHRSYEPDRLHRSYEPDRHQWSYEPDRHHRANEQDRHHRAYEPDRHHRAYEPDRHHRAYEPGPYEAPRVAVGRPLYR